MYNIWWIAGMLWMGILWGQAPLALYLTWVGDPTTTMVVQWHTPRADKGGSVQVKEASATTWTTIRSNSTYIPHAPIQHQWVELTGLTPDREYEFRVCGGDDRYSARYTFRTLPSDLGRAVRFAVGGDAYYYFSLFAKMNATVASMAPDFVVLGGDIAYAHGRSPLYRSSGWEYQRWQTFFSTWHKQMRTPEGRIIPLVVAVGNHDVNGSSAEVATGKKPPSLFSLFFLAPFQHLSYRVLDFGKYLSLFLLDTGHLAPIAGAQTNWLSEQLQEREEQSYKFAVYHVPGYPALVQRYHDKTPKRVRSHWSPLFEKYRVQAAFEHHNHLYKRTLPMQGEQPHPQGVYYLGDGSWGAGPRGARGLRTAKTASYIANLQTVNAFFLVTLTKEQCQMTAYDNRGHAIDVAPPILPVTATPDNIMIDIQSAKTLPSLRACSKSQPLSIVGFFYADFRCLFGG